MTLHPWLPSKAEQVARARAWGVERQVFQGQDVSNLIVDDARKVGRTTNWPGKLPERAAFIKQIGALKPENDQVFFATPLCVGFSEKHAQATVEALFDVGLSVYVHAVQGNGGALYMKGDDMSEFVEGVGKAANAAHQAQFRKRGSA